MLHACSSSAQPAQIWVHSPAWQQPYAGVEHGDGTRCGQDRVEVGFGELRQIVAE
ncbi:hypothetical protein OG698_08940 [Streptomyces sp. NBC_01003]|uniref:hypothetical protein n=1 Tax=Streptomyces sp. NBC_01003 TaxID=2903714 RepID=UPI0038645FAA|nr:hypothetical protein OG698_08940 [Streptomyces sp. NBC_01003]